uniref:Uncharacterized protein n=1 Tax=Oryza sativa subsp. japonica TaxID=39947 RepID=Q5Z7E5_ORYSJ|nr:hypothetical protein [Oryza sativa Japonica Group]
MPRTARGCSRAMTDSPTYSRLANLHLPTGPAWRHQRSRPCHAGPFLPAPPRLLLPPIHCTRRCPKARRQPYHLWPVVQ